MSLIDTLNESIELISADAALYHSIVNGPATGEGSETTTEGGVVWSLAKSVQYIINTGDTAIAGFNADGAAAIAAFNASAATALTDLQDAIDAIIADADTALKSQANVFTNTNTFNGVTLVATAVTTADTTNAVNVTMLRSYPKSSDAQATTTQRGTSRRATDADAAAGTEDTAHMTARGVATWAANDTRLGYQGGAMFTAPASVSTGGTTLVSPVVLNTIGFFAPTSAWDAVPDPRHLFKCGTLWNNGSMALRVDAGTRTLRLDNGTGVVNAIISGLVIPAGTTAIWLTHDETAKTVSIYFNGSAVAAATVSRSYTAGLLSTLTTVWGVASNATSFTGRALGTVLLNRLPTADERLAYARGEYPAKDLGGVVAAVQSTTTWTDSTYTASGGTITTNSGGTLTISHPGGGASASALRLALSVSGNTCPTPTIRRVVRVTMTTASVTGSVPISLRDSAGTLLATATTVSTSAAQTLDFTLTAVGNGSLEIHLGDTAAHSATITLAGITVLGAQILIGPENWSHTRARDVSGNCNDLIYGTGVVPISPTPFVRTLDVTTAGATVTAGTVSMVGTLTGVTYRDKQGITALRQWDGVKPSMGAADVANSTGLLGSATANSTLSIKSGATAAGNAVFAASTKIKVLVTE